MAEYVKKENIIDIIDNSSDLQEVKSCMMYGLETADVIERSKIDKAIEEIEDLDNAKYGFESYYQCKAEVLEILKKNIGE